MNAKLTKGLAAAAVSAAMMLGAAVPALAADAQATYTDQGTVNITKSYELEGQGVSPEETFTVTQDGAGTVSDSDATTAPALTNISTVTFAKGAAGSVNKTQSFVVTLPPYDKVGIYTYNLKETAGNTAGVTYRTDNIKLVVTVIEQTGLVRVAAVHCENEGGQKTSSFADNKYSAGELDVTKSVKGNLGDKKKEFKFTVAFKAPTDKSWTKDITVEGGASDLKWEGQHCYVYSERRTYRSVQERSCWRDIYGRRGRLLVCKVHHRGRGYYANCNDVQGCKGHGY
jgi:pilin isopeptide linkage protein